MRFDALLLFLSFGVASSHLSAQEQSASGAGFSFKRMADGKQWMTSNLSVRTDESYCYGDAEESCRRYGRLYTWASAQKACQALGEGWHLPNDEEWRQLA